MPGWMWLVVVAAAAAALFALAWWSSGRAKPVRGAGQGMSQAEKDYLSGETGRRAAGSGGNGLTGLGG